MASNEPEKPKSVKNGITYTRDFEVVEMSDLSASKSRSQFAVATSYSITANTRPRTSRKKSMGRRFVDSFRRVPGGLPMTGNHGYHINDDLPEMGQTGGRFYDLRAANVRTANSALARDLKGRHLQMIAIGGSVGTGLFVASGLALYQSGPASLLLGYLVTGAIQFCTMQSLGELVTTFPVAGSFSAFSSRFLDPSWGFAMGWNYVLQWLVVLPVEMISGALAIQYWNASLNPSIFVTIFLLAIVVINLMGIKGYGEAEFIFSTVKVTAIVGFILLGIVINIGGPPTSGYIGGQYWTNPGPIHNGFKGFCSVLVTSSFSFTGTEMVGLAAAETANPRKSLPSAIKQVFWRIAVFYIVSLLLVTLLVPFNEPRLLGGQSSVDAGASPFVIAVEKAGSTILPSVMNAVILIAVLSVGNSAIFGSSRTLASLAEQSHAPSIFSYVDRKGRPLALSYYSNPRFSQEFILPGTANHEAITISYADLGFKPESPTANRSTPTVLFIPGMFGSRYIGAVLDPVARKFGVRVLVVDRPGMGRSTSVPFPQRLSTWIRLVPLLLAHLDIEHVALVSHSAGTMYLLNTLHHYRNILHPERPFVALMAPWVDPAHSKATLWQMAQYVPTQAFGLWNHITPAFATSGTIFTKTASFFSSSIDNGDGQELSSRNRDRQKLAAAYDLPRDVQLELETMLMKKIFDENTTGANDEALQCLRKGKGWSWGECDDYSVFVKALVSAERQKKQLDPNFQDSMKLKIRAYFAESDVMIGVGGQKYVEECWGWPESLFDDVIDFSSVTVAGTDHDSVMQSIEVLEKLFADAGGSSMR
ncbi:hypothetical protein TrVFT333_010597 [Trichoderma virens FT-333]|nr:hypothetical protein TrVFT333_010597 [Trichoderma virens FT-333]